MILNNTKINSIDSKKYNPYFRTLEQAQIILFKIYHITFYYFNDEDNNIRIMVLKFIFQLEKLWLQLFDSNSEFFWQIFLDHNYLLKDKSQVLRNIVYDMIPLAKFIFFGFDNLKFYVEFSNILQGFFNLANVNDRKKIMLNFIEMINSNDVDYTKIEKWKIIKFEFVNHLEKLNIEDYVLVALFCVHLFGDSNKNLIEKIYVRIENIFIQHDIHLFSKLKKYNLPIALNVNEQYIIKDSKSLNIFLLEIMKENQYLFEELKSQSVYSIYYFWKTLKPQKTLNNLIIVFFNFMNEIGYESTTSTIDIKEEIFQKIRNIYVIFLLCYNIKLIKKMEVNSDKKLLMKKRKQLEVFYTFYFFFLKGYKKEIEEILNKCFSFDSLQDDNNQIPSLQRFLKLVNYKKSNYKINLDNIQSLKYQFFGKNK